MLHPATMKQYTECLFYEFLPQIENNPVRNGSFAFLSSGLGAFETGLLKSFKFILLYYQKYRVNGTFYLQLTDFHTPSL